MEGVERRKRRRRDGGRQEGARDAAAAAAAADRGRPRPNGGLFGNNAIELDRTIKPSIIWCFFSVGMPMLKNFKNRVLKKMRSNLKRKLDLKWI